MNAKDANGKFLVDPNEMRVVLWSHDGFNIAVRRTERIPFYQAKLAGLVQSGAAQLKIPTSLEWNR